MRRFAGFLVLGLLCLGVALMPAARGQQDKKEAGDSRNDKQADVTDEVRDMNSERFSRPPTVFRDGRVTLRGFDEEAYVTKTETGFSIQLTGGNPILTPTVYKGKLYVSGGFHSTAYYCFDAVTGEPVWAVKLNDNGPTAAVVEDDICVFITESCTLFALDAKTGQHLWSHIVGAPLTSTPTIAGGKVFTSYHPYSSPCVELDPERLKSIIELFGKNKNLTGEQLKKEIDNRYGNLDLGQLQKLNLDPAVMRKLSKVFPKAEQKNPGVEIDPERLKRLIDRLGKKNMTAEHAEQLMKTINNLYGNVALEQLQNLNLDPDVMTKLSEAFPNAEQRVEEAKNDAPAKAAVKQRTFGMSHVFACFELKTGKIVWQRWIDSDVMSAPVAVDNAVYATSFSGIVYKFQQSDGAILSATRSRATSAPVVVGNEMFLTQRADDRSAETRVVSEKITGVTLGTTGADSIPKFESAPREARYLDKDVQDKSDLKKNNVRPDGDGNDTPREGNRDAAWHIGQGDKSTMQAFQGSRILNFQDSNFNCMGDEIVCTDPTNGKVRWTVKLQGDLDKVGGFLASPPAAAGGKIFVATLQGEVLQLDPADGKLISTYKIGSPVRSQPAIDAGRIYVGTEDGKVVCVDTGNPEFTGWTTWGANSGHTNLAEKAK